jgi:hypothetical protein
MGKVIHQVLLTKTKQNKQKGKLYMNYYGHTCEDKDKYVAGAGTTAAAWIGTGLGILNSANGSGLGGIFGGGSGNSLAKENSALLAEVGQLKAEKYTDAQVANLFNAVRNLEQKQSATETSVICLQKDLTAYEIGQKEIQELNRKLTEKEISGVAKDLNCLAGKVESMGMAFNNRCNGIDAAIAGFTKTVIPQSAICDTSSCCYGSQQ